MKRYLVLIMFLLLTGVIGLQGRTQVIITDTPELKRLSEFMLPKLEHSKKVLEGIVREDFDMIQQHARTLGLLSADSNWKVIQQREYFERSREFQRTASTLEEMARQKNLDGASLAYLQLTAECFDCHKYVRDYKRQQPIEGKLLDKAGQTPELKEKGKEQDRS